MGKTLALDWEGLLSAVGQFMGYGDDPAALSAEQLRVLAKAINGGYRRACYPPGYAWSWMKSVQEVVKTKASIWYYPLPDHIANIEGPLTIVTTSTSYSPIKLVHEGVIRQNRSAGATTNGRPALAAFYHKAPEPGFPSGKRIEFWPTPDAAYNIQAHCQIEPLPLSADNPSPLGGPAFGQLFLEACLAEGERQVDDMQGIHQAAFQEQLAAALEQDKRLRSEFMGQMTDWGTPEARRFNGGMSGLVNNNFRVTFGGQEY